MTIFLLELENKFIYEDANGKDIWNFMIDLILIATYK